MRTFETLQQLWASSPAPPIGTGTVVALAVRVEKRVNESRQSVEISLSAGIVGDRWSHDESPVLGRQVSLMNARVAELVCDGEHGLAEPGDNLVVDLDLSEAALPVGTQLRVGRALIEITAEPHTGCKLFTERFGAGALRWVNHKDLRHKRFRGVYCKVVESGDVNVGDVIAVQPALQPQQSS